MLWRHPTRVIPAKAGTHRWGLAHGPLWVPAFAGMTCV